MVGGAVGHAGARCGGCWRNNTGLFTWRYVKNTLPEFRNASLLCRVRTANHTTGMLRMGNEGRNGAKNRNWAGAGWSLQVRGQRGLGGQPRCSCSGRRDRFVAKLLAMTVVEAPDRPAHCLLPTTNCPLPTAY